MMARTVKLTADGDIDVTYGKASFVTGAACRAQCLTTRFRAIKGEWFANLNIGLPLFTDILVHNPEAAFLEYVFADQALQVDGIATVENLELDLDTTVSRGLKVTISCRDVDGAPLEINDLRLR